MEKNKRYENLPFGDGEDEKKDKDEAIVYENAPRGNDEDEDGYMKRCEINTTKLEDQSLPKSKDCQKAPRGNDEDEDGYITRCEINTAKLEDQSFPKKDCQKGNGEPVKRRQSQALELEPQTSKTPEQKDTCGKVYSGKKDLLKPDFRYRMPSPLMGRRQAMENNDVGYAEVGAVRKSGKIGTDLSNAVMCKLNMLLMFCVVLLIGMIIASYGTIVTLKRNPDPAKETTGEIEGENKTHFQNITTHPKEIENKTVQNCTDVIALPLNQWRNEIKKIHEAIKELRDRTTWTKIEGKFYRYFQEPKTFEDANVTCSNESARLVISGVKNSETTPKIWNMVNKEIRNTWIGLKKEGSELKWLDGSNFTKHDITGDGDCVRLTRPARFLKYNCSESSSFWCEY